MMSVSTQFIDGSVETLVKKVIESEHFQNAKFNITEGTVKGDGYLGIIHAVKITSDDGRTVDVIVKTVPKSEHLRKTAELEQVYFHETYFYNDIYPIYLKFQAEKAIANRFSSVARCFATSVEHHSEGLVLENLLSKGYRMWTRSKFMNEEHMSLILREYGKFHAVGFALKDQKLEEYNEFIGKLVDIYERYEQNPDNVTSINIQLDKALEVLDEVEDKITVDCLNKFISNWQGFHKMLRSNDTAQYKVLVHGDCWCNNMLFKYQDNNDLRSVYDMKIIDWQVIHSGLPVYDITYIFYTSASKEILDNYRYYMHIYYESFSSHLLKMGSNPENLYPFSVFEEHWRLFCPNGLFLAIIMTKLMMSEVEEVPDLTQSVDGSFMKGFDYVPKDSGYKARLRDVILHFVKNNFI